MRERSRAELVSRLRQKGFSRHVVDEILDRLAGAGLQDDGRFAERYAGDAAARGKAGRLIQTELRGKGIDRELASAAAAVRPEEEEERAFGLARARVARMGNLTPEVRARRLLGLLARRGFDGDLCRRVAREVSGIEDDPS